MQRPLALALLLAASLTSACAGLDSSSTSILAPTATTTTSPTPSSPEPATATPAPTAVTTTSMLGTWSSSMIGSSTPSRRLKRFDKAIEDGQYLLIVDVPRSRITEIEELLARTHPEAHFEGLEPNVPAFP